MERLRYILILLFSIFFFGNCAHRHFENHYLTNISKDTSLVEFLDMVEDFENYLLKNNFLENIDKQNYKALMNKALKDEVVLQADSNFYNKVDAWLFMENFSFAQSYFSFAFENWEGKVDTLSSAYKLAQVQREIIEAGTIGDSLLNLKLIESINDSDFSKTIYRVPIAYIIFEILERNYSNYYEWKSIETVYFQENEVSMDIENSNFEKLDSICTTIKPENFTKYYFLVLGMDNANDSINYGLTVERTNYLVNYLIEKKGLHPVQINAYSIPDKQLWNTFGIYYKELYQNLYKKRKAQIFFKERKVQITNP